MKRFPLPVFAFVVVLAGAMVGQSPSGTISGLVLDPSGSAIPSAEILILNDATSVRYPSATNGDGIYAVPNLPPGLYRIQVSKRGFKTLIKPDVVLNIQSAVAINFTLPVGSVSEIVTVEGGASLVNTQSASVGTVIDRGYLENMPLNGRSLQDLILLTPGVVTNSPQQSSIVGSTGEFSVNGQRTEANVYMVDGVSSNLGVYPGDLGSGNSGSVVAATALGTSQAVVSLDSLQEFRVQTSTYSAEYGRSPGGQFSFVTRSGTNRWHATLFDYLRNDAMDANNWFNDFFHEAKTPLRQNDFGGTFEGPVDVPWLYRGTNKTFFFFSYEGLRLLQPQAAAINYVPDETLRQGAPSPLQSAINAFPVPNGPEVLDASGGPTGVAQFIAGWSNPSSLDAYSVRLDHNLRNKINFFFRFSGTPSKGRARQSQAGGGSPSVLQDFGYDSRTYTFGMTNAISGRLTNELRLNYSSNLATLIYSGDNFHGAQPVSLTGIQGLDELSSAAAVRVDLNLSPFFMGLTQGRSLGLQRQWNIVDSTSLSFGHHQLKAGLDYRRLTPFQTGNSPSVNYSFFSTSAVLSNAPEEVIVFNFAKAYPLYTNFSAFVNDDWKVSRRLSLSSGLRWEVNPAPGVTRGNSPYTVLGADNLSTMTLAPQGTPLWKTTWCNFAPRFGLAYVLHDTRARETVLRGGVGLFFDTGQQLGSEGFSGAGFTSLGLFGSDFGTGPSSFPIPSSDIPEVNPIPTPPYDVLYAYPTHLQLPYTIQWSLSLEQALGESNVLSASYVGSHAARLLQEDELDSVGSVNPNFTALVLFRNGLTADYDAAQAQFQRRLSRGLSGLAAYTWSHSIDYSSVNFDFPYLRGNSDFDVRHSFSSAFSYDLPANFDSGWNAMLWDHWGVDARAGVRSGFPVSLHGLFTTDEATGKQFFSGLNIVENVPLYLYGSQYPGGRAINAAKFTLPDPGQLGNAPRNLARGFGAWQLDLAIRREFRVHENARLQFRAEAFNVFNHPNYGRIDPNLSSPTFGNALATLNASLGTLSPLFQMGGPRSMQASLKLLF